MTEALVTEGQSLLDNALCLLGGTAGLFDLADANDMAITDQLSAGQVLQVPATAVRADVVSYFAAKGQRINTCAPAPPVHPIAYDYDRINDYSPLDYV